MEKRRVVITGMGAVSPAGIGVKALWEAAREGKTFGGRITRFDPGQNESMIAAEMNEDLDPFKYGFEEEQFARWDRSTIFAMVSLEEAVRQSGREGIDPYRSGVCIGSAIGGVEAMEYAFKPVARNMGDDEAVESYVQMENGDISPSMFHAYSCCSSSLEAARFLGLKGPVTSISTGCTAGVDAVGYCTELIRKGEADLMVSGGTDAALTPLCLTAFDGISAISRRNGEPNRASRPFDKDRDGFLMSEGSGIVILEEYEHALKRGAPILGEILGFGTNCNAYHMTGIPQDGADVARSLELALEDANLPFQAVDYINAHGSSTPQNDQAETAAYKRVFGQLAYDIPVSSTKSGIGHPLGAASALELIICVKASHDSWVPPTANLYEPSQGCDLDYVPLKGREREMDIILSNASGFGGLHSAVILKKEIQL